MTTPTRKLGDENCIVLVVAEVTVVCGAGLIVERHEVSLRVESTAHPHDIRGAFRVPGGFFVS